MGELPTKLNDRSAIAQEIDRAYQATVLNAVALQKFIVLPRGTADPMFLGFYECFATLFTLTSPYPNIAPETDETVKQIRSWLDPERVKGKTGDPGYALDGIHLFEEWQKTLAKKDVITWR